MNTKQKIVKLLITWCFISLPIAIYAYDFKSDGIYYNITSEEKATVEVTNYKLYDGLYKGDISRIVSSCPM